MSIAFRKMFDDLPCFYWCRQDFFGGGGSPGHWNAITPPPAGGPGGGSPPEGAKFHFFKRFKFLESESIFQKYQHWSCPKNQFFSTKTFKKLNWFYKDFLIFRKIISQISNFMEQPLNPEYFSWILLSG